MEQDTERYPGAFEDEAAISAVIDALQIYEDDASEAQGRLDRFRDAIRGEQTDRLGFVVSSKARDRLAHFSGWGREVLGA